MLDILNLVFLGGVMLANITLYSSDTYIAQKGEERDQVTEIHAHREWWRDDGKCDFTGLMVPYVRDWEEVDNGGVAQVVHPAEPDKTAGQAVLIYKKTCQGKEPELMLRTSEFWITRQGVMVNKQMFQAADTLSAPQDKRPKWLGQVLARVERVAKHDPKAKDFVDAMAQLQAQAAASRNTPAAAEMTAGALAPTGDGEAKEQ